MNAFCSCTYGVGSSLVLILILHCPFSLLGTYPLCSGPSVLMFCIVQRLQVMVCIRVCIPFLFPYLEYIFLTIFLLLHHLANTLEVLNLLIYVS